MAYYRANFTFSRAEETHVLLKCLTEYVVFCGSQFVNRLVYNNPNVTVMNSSKLIEQSTGINSHAQNATARYVFKLEYIRYFS